MYHHSLMLIVFDPLNNLSEVDMSLPSPVRGSEAVAVPSLPGLMVSPSDRDQIKATLYALFGLFGMGGWVIVGVCVVLTFGLPLDVCNQICVESAGQCDGRAHAQFV